MVEVVDSGYRLTVTGPQHPKGGTVQLVLGIVITVIGAPSLIRGLASMLLSVVNPAGYPEGTAFAFGVTLFGALVVASGVLLIASGSQSKQGKADVRAGPEPA